MIVSPERPPESSRIQVRRVGRAPNSRRLMNVGVMGEVGVVIEPHGISECSLICPRFVHCPAMPVNGVKEVTRRPWRGW